MAEWNNLENKCISAMLAGEDELADACLDKLIDKFPQSDRVKRLIGMQAETQGKYADALAIYDEILTTSPADFLTLKRKVCVFKEMNQKPSAISVLLEIVQKVNMGDANAWLELADLYLETREYQEAAHCLEECVLIDPYNCHYHNRLGDCYYSLGGEENYLKARKQYTISLNFQAPKNNLRGLIGLMYSCNAIKDTHLAAVSSSSSNTVKSDKDVEINDALLAWVKENSSDMKIGSFIRDLCN